jgi:hypothetical protein
MKKIIAIVVIALAVLHFGIDSTEGVRTSMVERTAVLDSI